jgi:hypothetical protein
MKDRRSQSFEELRSQFDDRSAADWSAQVEQFEPMAEQFKDRSELSSLEHF